MPGRSTPTMPRRPANSPKGIAQREKILSAATELFASRGYKGTGMLDIAERVGMTHSGILYHFGTKRNLLLEVIARRDQLHEGVIADFQATDGERTQSLRAEIVADVRELGVRASSRKNAILARNFMDPEVFTRLVVVLRAENLNPGDPLYEMFDLRDKQMRKFLADDIRAAQRRGEYRSDVNPEVKAVEILSFLIGLETQWLSNKEEVDVERVIESWARALLDDLSRSDAPRMPTQSRRGRSPTSK